MDRSELTWKTASAQNVPSAARDQLGRSWVFQSPQECLQCTPPAPQLPLKLQLLACSKIFHVDSYPACDVFHETQHAQGRNGVGDAVSLAWPQLHESRCAMRNGPSSAGTARQAFCPEWMLSPQACATCARPGIGCFLDPAHSFGILQTVFRSLAAHSIAHECLERWVQHSQPGRHSRAHAVRSGLQH